ncbi:MAG: hypothetical protein Q8L68_04895 [Methylococcales bacterium]|nr:hypothetical protein [Methylococcales bacterium]
MDTLAKMCEECIEYVAGRCEGREQATVKAGKKPCNKYVFATDELIGNLDNEIEETLEPTDNQLEAVEPVQVSQDDSDDQTSVDYVQPLVDGVKWDVSPLKGGIVQLTPKTRSTAFGSKPVEMKQADFQRLSVARCNKAIAAIKLLGNLNNKYAYAWDAENVQALRIMLENTIKDVFSQF